MSIQFPASKSLCNDLAKASEALDGKKSELFVQRGHCYPGLGLQGSYQGIGRTDEHLLVALDDLLEGH